MGKPEGTRRHKGLRSTLTMRAVAGALILTLPLTLPTIVAAHADPPAPAPAPAPAPPPDPNAPPPGPVDPAAPPPPAADPSVPPPPGPPEPGRTNVPAGLFSYVIPAGWTVGDPSRISYGQAVLLKNPVAGQPPPQDTTILLGKLDLKLFAGAEQDNTKAAIRLASDMGEFYLPFPGTRINQEAVPLDAAGMPGTAAFYEVKFTDTNKPNGQIWAGVVGTATPRTAGQPARNERWFVVWLGSSNNPVDKGAAKALAESIRPYAPPPPPPPPEAPQPDPNAPPPPVGRAPVGVPVPVAPSPEFSPPT